MAHKANFTKQFILNLATPETNSRVYIYDERTPGLALAMTRSGVKTFIVYKKVHGRPQRVKVGRFPDLTIEQARREAQRILGKIASGVNPALEKKERRSSLITLTGVFTDYLSARKNLKPGTIKDYHRLMKEVFADWQNKPLQTITKDMITTRHCEHGKRSQARANGGMRLLRALFNFAAGEYENAKGEPLFLHNPIKKLSHTRAWYKIDRRQTLIKSHELPQWFAAVLKLSEDKHNSKAATIRDYLLLLLLTGLRRQEGMSLTWDQIDFEGRTLTIFDTKNQEQHTLPLSDFLYEILQARVKGSHSEYVFPGDSKNGYINDPRKQLIKVIADSGVDFTLHDLRRTFITIAESLDIPAYALKRLLNHKSRQDVTAGYLIIDVERLRKPMQQITDYVLSAAGFRVDIKNSQRSFAVKS